VTVCGQKAAGPVNGEQMSAEKTKTTDDDEIDALTRE
jgi:hypothetical protein